MTREIAQRLKNKREGYIRGIKQNIRKKYPMAKFDIARGPGPKKAWIDVYAPTNSSFDVFDAVGEAWDRALEENFIIHIMPLPLKG